MSIAPGSLRAATAAVLFGVLSPAVARADRGLATTATALPADRGGAIVGLKLGGLFAQPFSALSGSYYLEVEGGYLLPFVRRLLSITASVGFAAPPVNGSGADPRLPGGGYSYSVDQRQLSFGLTASARIPLGRFVPYVGVGPRLFLVRTGSSAQTTQGVAIAETRETSTEIGLGVPLGLDVLLGPGRLFAEGQILWSAVAQRSTGESNLGALTLSAGYRLVL